MKYVGKIIIEKFQPVTDLKIISDDVILTPNRIEHIIERRGQAFYDEFNSYFADIVRDPDYIFKDKNDNTAIASKSVLHNGVNVNIVLRLAVAGDNPDYKNSIITAIKENDKRFAQRLRNNTPIYVKLDKPE